MFLDHLMHVFELPLVKTDALCMGDDGFKSKLRLAVRVADMHVHSRFFP